MICLLCQSPFQDKVSFCQLVFFTKSQNTLCPSCLSSFEVLTEGLCPACCKPKQDGLCSDCQAWQKQGHLPRHQALFSYNEAMKDYFSRFKFEGDYLLARAFAGQLKQALKQYKSYVLVPVPLGPKRYEARQFNQVTALLDAAGLSYQDILVKEEMAKQSDRTRQERLQAVCPFSLKEGQSLPAKVLIIDDIYTTGATLAGIYGLLRENGVRDIKSFSLAR